MTKWLVIVAGPNGAGKSTFVSTGAIQRVVATPENPYFEILNPDSRAVRIAGAGHVTPEINLRAAQEVEAEVQRAIGEARSIGVETVLSSPKYRPLVERALDSGFRVMLHYIVLAQSDLHIRRVGQRVALGGHDVPAAKIADRYVRSLEQLPWFAKRATRGFLWDNSRLGEGLSELPLIAEKGEEGIWQQHAGISHMSPTARMAVQRVLAGQG